MPSPLWKVADRFGLTNASKFRKFVLQDRIADPEPFAKADLVLLDFHSGGGLTGLGEMQPYKLVSLERLLETHRPKSILEIGSGSSTVVIASYAKRTGAKFTSVDESPEWVANTASMLDSRGLADVADVIVRPKRLDASKQEAFYLDMPQIDADLVLIDGPALEQDGRKYLGAACVDIFDLPAPSVILVDMRLPTVNRMEERLSGGYRVSRSDVLARRPRARFQYFSIFERA